MSMGLDNAFLAQEARTEAVIFAASKLRHAILIMATRTERATLEAKREGGNDCIEIILPILHPLSHRVCLETASSQPQPQAYTTHLIAVLLRLRCRVYSNLGSSIVSSRSSQLVRYRFSKEVCEVIRAT